MKTNNTILIVTLLAVITGASLWAVLRPHYWHQLLDASSHHDAVIGLTNVMATILADNYAPPGDAPLTDGSIKSPRQIFGAFGLKLGQRLPNGWRSVWNGRSFLMTGEGRTVASFYPPFNSVNVSLDDDGRVILILASSIPSEQQRADILAALESKYGPGAIITSAPGWGTDWKPGGTLFKDDYASIACHDTESGAFVIIYQYDALCSEIANKQRAAESAAISNTLPHL